MSCDYHVIALVPGDSCNVPAALAALADAGYSAETAEQPSSMGFRVVGNDGWAIVAWIDDGDDTLELISELSDTPPDGVDSSSIQACKQTLSIWSDDDPDLRNAHVFEEFIQCLKDSLGYFIFDNRQGMWR